MANEGSMRLVGGPDSQTRGALPLAWGAFDRPYSFSAGSSMLESQIDALDDSGLVDALGPGDTSSGGCGCDASDADSSAMVLAPSTSARPTIRLGASAGRPTIKLPGRPAISVAGLKTVQHQSATRIASVLGTHPSTVKASGLLKLTNRPAAVLKRAGVHPRVAAATGLLNGLGDLGEGEEVPSDGDFTPLNPLDPSQIDDGPTQVSTPGAVPVVANAWDLDSGVYTLQSGNTIMGLSITYLGDPTITGIMKIWHADPANQSRNINSVAVGTRMVMPPEAVANAKRLIVHPGAKVAPNGAIVTPQGTPVPTTPADIVASVKGLSLAAKVGLGLGVAALGYGAYRLA